MMYFFILANQYVTLNLGPHKVTTLHFKEKIHRCIVGAPKEEVEYSIVAQRTAAVFIPKSKKIDSNITCFTDKRNIYTFNLKFNPTNYHKNITISKGGSSRNGDVFCDRKKYKILESSRNYYIINKSQKPLIVNEMEVKKNAIISKWLPITIDGEEVYTCE